MAANTIVHVEYNMYLYSHVCMPPYSVQIQNMKLKVYMTGLVFESRVCETL